MQKDIRYWCGAGSVVHQAGSAPGPQPQRGPPSTTGQNVGREGGGNNENIRDSTNRGATLVLSQWNAEGVRNKKPELQEFLYKNKVDIICIQETHLTEAHRFFVRGYQEFRNDRKNRTKGGVITFVKNTLPATEISRSSENSCTEFIVIKVVLPDKEISIVNAYCPSDRDLELNAFTITDNTIIMGDFNSHSPSWGYEKLDSRGETIEDWIIENQFILINKPDDEPTYWSRAWKKTSTPDIAFTTEEIQKMTSREVCDQLGGSDHRPVLIKVHQFLDGRSNFNKPSWNYKKADWNKFAELTNKYCKESPYSEKNNIHNNVKKFTSSILKAAKESIPRGRRQDYKPYWSDTMEELHENLTKTRENMEVFGTNESIAAHSQARQLYDEEKMKGNQKAWIEKTESLNLEKDGTKVWKLTKTLNEDYQETRKATVIKENNEHFTGKKAANKLAETFKENCHLNVPREKAEEIRHKIREESRKQEPNSCMSENFTIQELNKAIQKLKNKKAPGPDEITNEMIKHLGTFAKEQILEVINQSWNTGEFPSMWKEAIIIPLLKKGKDKTDKKSYRPISLLSCLGKTMERMVNNRLQYHLEKNGLINPFQSGYRKHRNTEDQVTYLTQEIENAFQQKMKTLAVFVDLTSAFDKVWKEGLLYKLLKKHISDKMYKWTRNFLFQRTARVRIDGYTSCLVKLREGVPQGGVISPTLFLIFIDDITDKLTSHISRALHADDLAVWTAAENISTAFVRMQMTVEKLGKWADEWMVTINRKKTEATVFSLSPKKEVINLKINGEVIPQQDTPTYLGVKLDRRLTWGPQISQMESKAVKKMAVMKKLSGTKWGANARILKQVYTGYVRPQLEYGATSWGTASKTNTSKLSKVQNASLRIITGGMKTSPICTMETTANIKPLEERRKEKSLIQSEKIKRLPTHPLHNKLKESTKNRLKRSSPNHLIKTNEKDITSALPSLKEATEILVDYEEWDNPNIKIETNVPGIGEKNEHGDHQLKNLTLEYIDTVYPQETWTQVYTDGSSENAVRNGGGGIHIRYPNGLVTDTSIATGKYSTNYRAESCAILHAAKTLNSSNNLTNSSVILTDCKSVLQSLESGEESKIFTEIKKELKELNEKTNIVLQWIPAHCGIPGNEKADKLSKDGSKSDQNCHSLSYKEAKTIIKSTLNENWNKDHANRNNDEIGKLNRTEQVIIFRLRTGHCRLLAHLYRLKISHTDECPCGTGTQTPEHLLQECPQYNDLREKTWNSDVGLEEKLYGSAAELQRTAEFVKHTGLTI